MEKSDRSNEIVLLLETFSLDGQALYNSLRAAGYNCIAVVIDDDGFLPEGVISVFGHYLGDYKGKGFKGGRPRYFNQIPVPEFWRISGNNKSGRIHDLGKERGRIFYAEPCYKRFVRVVDWLDDSGKARSCDHYNKYGCLYARTILSSNVKKVNKTYFDADGREVIHENFVTGNIILNEGNKVKIFDRKVDFIIDFLKKMGYEDKQILFNSLSKPFIISQNLNAFSGKHDVLFWQEPTGEEIPGNMKIILEGKAKRANSIIVQNKISYEKLIKLGAKSDMIKRLGYIYPFKRNNAYSKNVLICTSSDKIEALSELAAELPEVCFHIAAFTEMSAKLTEIGLCKNVVLYPGIKRETLGELFNKCDYYLDINHEQEMGKSVSRAFLHNQLIFAFEETLHSSVYVATENIVEADNKDKLIDMLKTTIANKVLTDEKLEKQHQTALVESPETYERVIGDEVFW